MLYFCDGVISGEFEGPLKPTPKKLSKLIDEPVKTFSIGFESDAPVNETRFAKHVAEYNGTDHTELLLKADFLSELPNLVYFNDDLFADAAIIPVYLMRKHAKRELNIVFTGDGADEVFVGYSIYYKGGADYIKKTYKKALINVIMKFYNYIPSYKLKMILLYLSDYRTEDCYFRSILKIPDKEMPKAVPFEVDSNKSILKSTLLKNFDIHALN